MKVQFSNNFFLTPIYVGGTGVATLSNNTFAFLAMLRQRPVITEIIFFTMPDQMRASTGKHYAIKIAGTAPNPAGTTINFNDYLMGPWCFRTI